MMKKTCSNINAGCRHSKLAMEVLALLALAIVNYPTGVDAIPFASEGLTSDRAQEFPSDRESYVCDEHGTSILVQHPWEPGAAANALPGLACMSHPDMVRSDNPSSRYNGILKAGNRRNGNSSSSIRMSDPSSVLQLGIGLSVVGVWNRLRRRHHDCWFNFRLKKGRIELPFAQNAMPDKDVAHPQENSGPVCSV